MDKQAPFFTIVIPTYNRSGLIADTLNSLLNQTFKDFELVVVDDGSTDDTESVMSKWVAQDERIRYLRKANGERGAARNFGVQNGRGTYVMFIDSDDVAYPFALETAYQELEQAGWPPCLALRYEVRDKATMKETMSSPEVKEVVANEALKRSNVLGCIGVFLNREIALSLPFEEDRKFAGSEDWLLWLKLAARYPIIYIKRICFCIYQHEDRSVMNFPEDKLRYRAEQIRKFLLQDERSVRTYGVGGINSVYAHMLTYASLHLAMSRKRGLAIQYLFEGIKTNFKELFTRRTLGIFKTVLFG